MFSQQIRNVEGDRYMYVIQYTDVLKHHAIP